MENTKNSLLVHLVIACIVFVPVLYPMSVYAQEPEDGEVCPSTGVPLPPMLGG